MASLNYSNYPLRDILEPHDHDVLCGRGGGTNNHIGNSHWRLLVAANKQLYVTLPKRQKMLLSRSIVNAVRSQNPPGRFLQKNSKTNKWYDVGDQRAQEKTSQALREGAPDLKKKTSGGKSEDEGTEQSESKPSEVTDSTASSYTAPAASTPPVSPKQTPQVTPSYHVPYGSMPNPAGFPAGMPGMPHIGMPQQYFPNPHLMHMQMAQMNQQQQGVMLYAGPNMQPVRLFPTMVMNEHGMMVPGMSMMPAGMMPSLSVSADGSGVTHSASNQQPQSVVPPQVSGQGVEAHHPMSNATGQDDTAAREKPKMPTFDEFVAAPPPDGFLDTGMSFGSTFMADAEMMMKLQANGTFGSVMSYKEEKDFRTDDDAAEAQAPGSLEPTGISFGDISMMSTGTNRLEAGGTSFGTMMSVATNMPDGGLEAIGTSFGSLSLDPWNREQLFQALELTGGGPEIPPMFHSEAKATGNLLECSDTESEGSQEKPELVAHKSEAWEKMRASVAQTQLFHSQSKGSAKSTDLMPPPVTVRTNNDDNMINGAILSVPSTSLERDFSQLSAWDDDGYDGDHDVGLAPTLQTHGVMENQR